MKYYKIEIQIFYPNNRIASTAVGDKISNIAFYFEKMKNGETLEANLLLDFFYLDSYDKKEYWEWYLFDVYDIRAAGIQLPNWFISEDLRKVLENFKLPYPRNFYPSKLLYKEKKLNYYIFQFAGKAIIDLIRTEYIDWGKSIFFNPIEESYLSIKSVQDFIDKSLFIMRVSNYEKEIRLKRLCLTEALDFFPMATFLHDNIVSERLKNAIETMGIEGFEFSELDYEVCVEGQ